MTIRDSLPSLVRAARRCPRGGGIAAVGLLVATAAFAPGAEARPSGPFAFCDEYTSSPLCSGTVVSCTLCHTDTGEASMGWNDYGSSLFGPLSDAGHTYDEASFGTLIGAVVLEVEGDDADGDGLSNLEEILLGTQPGDLGSSYTPAPAPAGAANPTYTVGDWDPEFALRRVAVAYCGASPTLEELETVRDSADPRAEVHSKLDACLAASFWRDTELRTLADVKIRPIDRFFQWQWDYRLWRWANLDDHDSRDLLTGQYHVRELTPGILSRVDGDLPKQACTTTAPGATECEIDQACNCPKDAGECTAPGTCQYLFGDQPCVEDKRAGMITTSWFHFSNTMFSAMPRTTAAQAMRAYLDLDPAKQQGLTHVEGEPLDLDQKGVTGYTCRQCHMAIDTATYAFAEYQGIEVGGASLFNANRPALRGLWNGDAERPQAYFLTEEVDDLIGWATAAANSDYFARQQAATFFQHATGRPPAVDEADEFESIWRALMTTDAYQTSNLLHRIVDSDAFGCP